MDAYSKLKGTQAANVRFSTDGVRVEPDDTAESLALEDGDVIEAVFVRGLPGVVQLPSWKRHDG